MNGRPRRVREEDTRLPRSGPPRNRRTTPKPGGGAPSVARRTLRERLAVIPAAIAGGFARLRPFAIVLGRWVVVGAAILGLVALFRVLERHVRTSPAFAAREIQVEGTHRLSEGEVAQIAGLAIGQNVFEVAPEEARRRLLASPWIAEAEVRRRLPGRWTLTIREREPVALLALSGTGSGALERATASSFEGLFLVSDEGTVFKQLEPGDPADLPVITGIDADRFAADRNFRTRILLAIVALLSDWRASGLWRREPIAEIHVEPDDAITLRVGDDATEIRLGHGPYRPKLERLGRVLGELDRRHARPAYVYLDHVRRPDRVVVRVR